MAEAGLCQSRVNIRAEPVGSGGDGLSFGRSGHGVKRFLPDLNQGVGWLGTLGVFLVLMVVLAPSRVGAQQPLSKCFLNGSTIERELFSWGVPSRSSGAHERPEAHSALPLHQYWW